jgi:hypothetical protein
MNVLLPIVNRARVTAAQSPHRRMIFARLSGGAGPRTRLLVSKERRYFFGFFDDL